MSRSGLAQQILRNQQQFHTRSNDSSSIIHLVRILKSSADRKNLKAGMMIHAHLITCNRINERFITISNSLINLYSKCSDLRTAKKLFDDIPSKNVVSWSALMFGYFQSGSLLDVFILLKRMLMLTRYYSLANEYIFTMVISCCTQSGRIKEARQCHGFVFKSALIFHHKVKKSLLNAYLRCYDVQNVKKMIHELAEWEEDMWVNLLGLSADLTDLKLGSQVHGMLEKRNFECDVHAGSAMVNMYGKCRKIMSAKKVFESLQSQNVVSFTSMLTAYLHNGMHEEMLNLFSQHVLHHIRANEFTFAMLLNACTALSILRHGESLHALLAKMGYHWHVIVSNSLITMYAKSGDIAAANKLFSGMVFRDTISWNAMICGYAHHGLGKEAMDAFQEMLKDNEIPTCVSFLGVLSACGHLGLVREGFYYLNKMKEFSITPELEHYTCIVGAFCKAGRVDEALDFMTSMHVEWDVVAWRSLLNACYVSRRYELAKLASALVLKMDVLDGGTHTLLSNMFAKAMMWDGVSEVRKLMKDRNIKKEPGASWIEIRNTTHVFVSDDHHHPQRVAIIAKVKELTATIKPLGYVMDTNVVLHDIDDEQKEEHLIYHSERLAVAYGLLMLPLEAPVRVMKNLRVCEDCHTAMKFISKATGRLIVVRDANRFHHFQHGHCSCADLW